MDECMDALEGDPLQTVLALALAQPVKLEKEVGYDV